MQSPDGMLIMMNF